MNFSGFYSFLWLVMGALFVASGTYLSWEIDALQQNVAFSTAMAIGLTLIAVSFRALVKRLSINYE